jgi:hypothetical protein
MEVESLFIFHKFPGVTEPPTTLYLKCAYSLISLARFLSGVVCFFLTATNYKGDSTKKFKF